MAPSDSKASPHTVKPWSAEHALTGAFACGLIEKQFPELKTVQAQLRGLYSCMYIYRYGLDIHDTDLVREGKQGMQWIASLYP